tara:strand:- start:604 stop:831 length:228 start_codon:yes stop_codon:yes gene_type:complete
MAFLSSSSSPTSSASSESATATYESVNAGSLFQKGNLYSLRRPTYPSELYSDIKEYLYHGMGTHNEKERRCDTCF